MVYGASNDSWAAYGATQTQHLEAYTAEAQPDIIMKKTSAGRQRMKMDICSIFVSLFLPWLLFVFLYADVTFSFHYKVPTLCWFLVGLGACFVSAIGVAACVNIKNMNDGSLSYQPTWLLFLFLTSLVAIAMGPWLGNANFWDNMQPYYDLQRLNDYSGVDPTRMRGQQMMDAGRVEFLKGATLDLSKAYAFQNLETYCVAPITIYNPQLGSTTPLSSYDFWAVGINCCAGSSSQEVDFKCGDFANADAHEGLRLMHDDQRSFMRLAVQQAEAAHMIKADHPLFFYWANDAASEMNAYLANAFKRFACCMCGFFVAQLILVVVVSYVLSKTGYNSL